MRIRPRFTIRALLIGVAALAIVLGALIERIEVRERDFYASQEQIFLDFDQEALRIASDCRARAESGPVDPTDPLWVELDRRWGLAKQRITDWEAAVRFFADASTGYRKGAALHSRFKNYHQGRILLLK